MTRILKRLIAFGLAAMLLLIAILAFQLLRFQHGDVAVPVSGRSVFLIRSGSNIKSIAQDLTREKIIEDPWLFILLAKLKGVETKVRAGEYEISAGQSADELLQTFTEGSSIQYNLTVIEGWTFRQMLDAVAQDPILEQRTRESIPREGFFLTPIASRRVPAISIF